MGTASPKKHAPQEHAGHVKAGDAPFSPVPHSARATGEATTPWFANSLCSRTKQSSPRTTATLTRAAASRSTRRPNRASGRLPQGLVAGALGTGHISLPKNNLVPMLKKS